MDWVGWIEFYLFECNHFPLGAYHRRSPVALLGIITERLVIRPVYGSHLFQIFITVGAMIVMEELIRIVWGPNDEVMPVPISFMGLGIFLMWWYRSILSLLLS